MRSLLLTAIGGYRRWLPPTAAPTCRFYPSCSSYAATAIEQYGAAKGSWLAIKRLIRCHPYHPGGYDPIP